MKKLIARITLVFLAGMLILFLYFAGVQGTNVRFQSSDGNWADSENLFKGRVFSDVVFLFELYRIKCKSPLVSLQRTTKRPRARQLDYWFDNFSDPKWKIPYIEPNPDTISGNYRSKENGQCAMRGTNAEENAQANELAVKFIDSLKHNKSLNTDAG